MRVVKCVTMVGMLLVGPAALAQERDQPRQPARPGERASPVAQYQRIIGQLNLEGDQQARAKQILETFSQAMDNWQKQHGEQLRDLQAQLRTATEERDQAKGRQLRAEIAKLTADQEKQRDKANAQLLEVLKGEQKERFVRALLGNRRLVSPVARVRLALKLLELNRSQTEQSEKILAAAEAEAEKAENPRERGQAMQKAIEEIKTKVLADEAKGKKLDELLGLGGGEGFLAGLNLTEEQQKKVREIMDEANKKAAQAEPEQRRAIRREAFQKIQNEVLTEQQREELGRRREQMRPRGEGQEATPRPDTPRQPAQPGNQPEGD